MPVIDCGPFDKLSVEDVLQLLPSLVAFPPATTRRSRSKWGDRSRGTARILDWLKSFPGDGWQERWLVSGADSSVDWIDVVTDGYGCVEASRREVTTDGLGCLLLARVVRSSYEFLQCYRTSGLYRHAKQEFGTGLFSRLRQAGMTRGTIPSHLSTAENSLVKVAFRTGCNLAELTAEDLIAYHDWHKGTLGKAPMGLHAAWDLLRDIGVLDERLCLRRTLARGQLPTTQLFDRYGIQCGPVRDVFVRYMDERRPSLDYSSVSGLASQLVGAFWADIEKHHPGISSLHLAPEVAEAWKQRVKVISRPGKDPVPREAWASVLTTVRAFCLDIAEWALEDPSWAVWAVPSPVHRSDTGGFTKVKKKARAKMHQRVRERLPRLPELVDTTERHHAHQRRVGWRRDVITTNMVYQLLNDTLARATLTDQAGQPLRYTPHDFRRIFATEAVAGGLPVHIAARLLGHASVVTTEAYVAVFQEDLIRSYRAFLDKRRSVRPVEEYREPTDDEWREFQEHFHTRKLELGDCARPYGTPCQHEHSCLRCPMLRVSPRQRERLVEIIRNLSDRIDEARMNGWLGEVQGLQVSLSKAREKLVGLDRSIGRTRSAGSSVHLGMPTIAK
ncbi:site-specific integrase [Streptomyces ipomoeae]|nr:site-specific integrase [Streptomyces ipomoeae]